MTERSQWLTRAALLLGGALALFGASSAAAQQTPSTEPDYPRGRISGYLFGDAYYNVVGEPESTLANIDPTTYPPKVIGRDLNGFQIRRIYFQADNDLSAKFSTRFRLEMDSKALTSDGKIGVYVKAAYLQAKNVVSGGNFLFGMVQTPTFENAEDFWQYRSIEKTIADFRGIASSSDLGVAFKGYVDPDHHFGYSALLGDGTGQRPENNRYKRGYLSVPLKPIEYLTVEPYADYEGGPGKTERETYKLFAGYELKQVAIGWEIVDQIQHTTGATREPFGFSIFARAKLVPQVLGGFARFDRWQPDTRAADRVDTDLYIAGLDWTPIADVHIMPNVEATQYRARGLADPPPHHDLQARITFYYRWSKP
jgi:hypothetical protein